MPRDGADNRELGVWCSRQRTQYRNSSLSRSRISRLEKLGFVWDPLGAAWEVMFDALRAYKGRYGNCEVPEGWPDNPELARWCGFQRGLYKSKRLPLDRAARLARLSFAWDPLGRRWEGMFAALAVYKRTHGNVSSTWTGNSGLREWCSGQRKAYKSGKLAPDRVKRLERLGFVWNPFGAAWEEMFGALCDYERTHGDCNVPKAWSESPGLWAWCQNRRFKVHQLSPDRIKRLKDIGFQFDRRSLGGPTESADRPVTDSRRSQPRATLAGTRLAEGGRAGVLPNRGGKPKRSRARDSKRGSN